MMSDISWLPTWAMMCLLIIAGLFGLALLCMPFAVFGVKPRLQELEFQIAELRAELQSLTLRLTAPPSDRTVASGPVREDSVRAPSRATPEKVRAVEPAPSKTADYFEPVAVVRAEGPTYEDGPMAADPEVLRRAVKRQEPAKSWSRAPWEEERTQAGSREREELAPRSVATRSDDEETLRRRAEPKLRWPPRG
ncbi:hypothetical protein NBRC3257_0182 [Gluconobacter thailandicus NBRC 3257]|uniref:Uncharacterized protein n=1 Tax=Gluconobacter thailandicus NBRC 3257 TaxID=1381097 RepID=A0ABQ0ISJ5_GLUTH|nr:hypothetical protein [Gluconobacter thailandicus]KXV53349.1 hypothetical protein AD946_08170 [Gluconobacter thailandicus]GAC88370.1 hypothetical protein NBRC3255_2031 [Gluconobacter thailandicus NBRC 3255]GAD25183.1 hypothetical protein NBRC3257_0182 [Gluconobacter thailandicus NBRC 3257]GBR59040.1 hypothetical protein AA100600_1108 [Gluconobacter thailandicus F149-1 = NBRC 100600]